MAYEWRLGELVLFSLEGIQLPVVGYGGNRVGI